MASSMRYLLFHRMFVGLGSAFTSSPQVNMLESTCGWGGSTARLRDRKQLVKLRKHDSDP